MAPSLRSVVMMPKRIKPYPPQTRSHSPSGARKSPRSGYQSGDGQCPPRWGDVCLGKLGFKSNAALYQWGDVTPGHPQASWAFTSPCALGTPQPSDLTQERLAGRGTAAGTP